jgi:hypothetical protein
MNSEIECRYASLLAFAEARDTQLALPLSGDNCGRESGRFAPGNTCAADGGSGSGGQKDAPSRPRANPVAGGPRANTSNGFPTAWRRDRPISHKGGLPGMPDIAEIKVDNGKRVSDIAKESGVASAASLVRLGAADAKKSEVDISSSVDRVRLPGSDSIIDAKTVTIESKVPVYIGGTPEPGQRPVGHVGLEVSLRKYGDDPPHVYYGLFDFDYGVQTAIRREKSASQHGDSPIERLLGASIIDKMVTSLEEAEKAGLSRASTYAAGDQSNPLYKGYRLWGRFGFDAPLSRGQIRKVQEALASRNPAEPILSPENENKLRLTDSLTLQELLSTKPGEKWWSQHGYSMNMTLDFTDKDSPGYVRYRKMLEKTRRAKGIGRRAFEDFCEFAAASHLDLSEWRGFDADSLSLECRVASLMAFAEARNCGTGSGGFQAGNTCASSKLADAAEGAAKGAIKGAAVTAGVVGPIPHIIAKGAVVGAAAGAVKGLYDNAMQPTRVMNQIKKIGTSEEQVASLVKRLGGSPKSVAKVKNGALTLHVKNDRGEKMFDVELGEKQYTIVPGRKSGTLSSSEMAQVKKIADENSPKEVAVVVKSKSASYVAKLVRKGFQVTANAAGTLIATVVAPMSPAIVGTVVEMTADVLTKKKK